VVGVWQRGTPHPARPFHGMNVRLITAPVHARVALVFFQTTPINHARWQELLLSVFLSNSCREQAGTGGRQ